MEQSRLLKEKIKNEEADYFLIEFLKQESAEEKNNKEKLFQYAIALSKDTKLESKQEASRLLNRLLEQRYAVIDVLYSLSLLHFGMEDYEKSRYYVEELLRINPDNTQGAQLHLAAVYEMNKQQERKQQETIETGIAVGGIALALAVGALIVTSLVKKK